MKKNLITHNLSSTAQSGFSQLLLVGLLAAGIIAGTLLIESGTGFLPRAQEQEPLNPSAGATKNCANEADKETCQQYNDAVCARDTVTYCDNRNGSPRAIRKSGGYYDPSDPNTDPASGCVFDYREVPNKNSECGKTESKSGDVVFTTKEEAQQLDKERRDSEPSRRAQSGERSSQSDKACVDQPGTKSTTDAFKDEKVAGNLVRFEAILAGLPKYCTPADLGVGQKLEEKGANGQTGRLLLCSNTDGSITWRVIQGAKLEPAQRQTPTTPDEIRAMLKSYLDLALGITK